MFYYSILSIISTPLLWSGHRVLVFSKMVTISYSERFTARWSCEAVVAMKALAPTPISSSPSPSPLLLYTLHLSDSLLRHIVLPASLHFCQSSHCLISPLSPSIIISTTPLGPLLHRHSLGFASGGQKLHQASWNRPVHPCGPAEEHSGGEQKIWKPYFETLLYNLMSNERWLRVYSRPSEAISM